MSTERNTSSPLPFRRLTARSVLLSVLLGTDTAWLPTPLLLSTTGLFGIADGTARTALSRMTSAGEVEPTGDGYRIRSSDLLARQNRQATGRSGATGEWDSTWIQVVVGLGERRSAAERAAVRAALVAGRFGELREGVWLRPNNLSGIDELEFLGDDALVANLATVSRDGDELAATLWNLTEWAHHASELITLMSPLADRLERDDHDALADGFVLNAAVLRLVAADPLLPDPLLPARWPGRRLRDAYQRYDTEFRRVIEDHFDRHRSAHSPRIATRHREG